MDYVNFVFRPWGPFLQSSHINGPVELLLFTCKLEVSIVAPNVIKISVNETKWSNLLPGPMLLFSLFRFGYLIPVPKSYWDFREMCPWDNTTL